MRIAGSPGDWNEKCCMLWPGASNMAICRSSQSAKGEIDLNIEPNSSFSVGCISSPKGRDKRRYKVDLKHLAVTRNCIYAMPQVYGRHSIRHRFSVLGV